jgi:hypothetical protein
MILYDMRGVPILWQSAYVTLSATDVAGLGVFELCTTRSPQGFWLRLNAITKRVNVPSSEHALRAAAVAAVAATPPTGSPSAVQEAASAGVDVPQTALQTQFRFIDLYVPLQQLNNWFSMSMTVSDTLTKLPRM